MPPNAPRSAAPAPTANWKYRLAVPVLALVLFSMLAALWQWGPHSLYLAALSLFGFEPFRFPFLDIHAVLAAAQCHRQGIDVYLYNPCDVLGRPHVYSPLWLTLTPSFLGTSATTAVGVSLDLLVILSLALVIRPATGGEALVLGLAALSPMTVYALERANCDLVIFLLIVGGCVLDRAPRPWRFGCYALYLLAGLLKYYPLVLLVLMVRERRREAVAGAAIAALVVLGLAGFDHADLAKALANIPALSYFFGSFSAQNLPFGFAEAVGAPDLRHIISVLLLSMLAALAARPSPANLAAVGHGGDRLEWRGGAMPPGRRAAGRGLLLRRPEHQLPRHIFCAGDARAGAFLPIGRRTGDPAVSGADDRRRAVRRLGTADAPDD